MRIPVVEDSLRMAGLLRRGLTEEGYAVVVASTGEDGVWIATEEAFDAVVLDVVLPDIDGYEVWQAPAPGGTMVAHPHAHGPGPHSSLSRVRHRRRRVADHTQGQSVQVKPSKNNPAATNASPAVTRLKSETLTERSARTNKAAAIANSALAMVSFILTDRSPLLPTH